MATSAGIGAGVWAAAGSPFALPAAIVAGVLVDADHVIDTLDDRDGDTHLKMHMWRPFHAWEYAILGFVIFALFWNNPVFLAFLLGYASHILLDNFINVTHPLAYSIFFRASRGFRRRRLTPHLFDPQYREAHIGPVPFWAKLEPTVWSIIAKRRSKRR